jgi:hypothetical protein
MNKEQYFDLYNAISGVSWFFENNQSPLGQIQNDIKTDTILSELISNAKEIIEKIEKYLYDKSDANN